MDTALCHGHRARLRERFVRHGAAGLSGHEIIELLLTFAIPRKDTKTPAKLLLNRFGSLGGVLSAGPDRLRQVEGVGPQAAALLSLAGELTGCLLRERIEKRPAAASRADVEQYLRVHFGQRRDEFVAALFLDNAGRVISAEVVAEGTVNQCALYPRAVVEKAIGCGAASLIIAHNHPGGTTSPSEADWEITRRIAEVCGLLDMPLLDHLIACPDTVVSLREHTRWPGRK